ncbi:hypothetical protein [Pirellulimonas nuda]|uniref:hypothetical protein n=1 Tax=Pirellulimonas nuda TaxID=2528009 RepID=UPI00119EAB31|nr:hypothetical protein [Pirellulimonas nuda]
MLALSMAAAIAGCDSGPPRYSVTGRVLCNGEPVPQGKLIFTPDRTANNSGGQGVAIIENGRIRTQSDRRLVGGPHWVQIIATDGKAYDGPEGPVSAGKALFPIVDAQAPLPQADAEIEINVTTGRGDPKAEVTVK